MTNPQEETEQPQPAIDDKMRKRVLKEMSGKLGWAGNTLPGGMQAYKTPRSSESGSGTAVANFNGEDYVLLIQPKKHGGAAYDHWEFPAGYRELVAEANLDGSSKPLPEGSNKRPVDAKEIHKAMVKERDRMLQAGTSPSEVMAFFEDEEKVENFLVEQGFDWDKDKLDATLEGAFIRELKEETGIKVRSSQVEPVGAFGTLNISSGRNARNNHTDHMFLAELGTVNALPEITVQKKEIADAKWVKVSDIQYQDGAYKVEGGMPLDIGHAMRMHAALEKRNSWAQPSSDKSSEPDSSMIPGEQTAPSFASKIPFVGRFLSR